MFTSQGDKKQIEIKCDGLKIDMIGKLLVTYIHQVLVQFIKLESIEIKYSTDRTSSFHIPYIKAIKKFRLLKIKFNHVLPWNKNTF